MGLWMEFSADRPVVRWECQLRFAPASVGIGAPRFRFQCFQFPLGLKECFANLTHQLQKDAGDDDVVEGGLGRQKRRGDLIE